jgi:hypothetical protein
LAMTLLENSFCINYDSIKCHVKSENVSVKAQTTK